jgi:hypothetical protein
VYKNTTSTVHKYLSKGTCLYCACYTHKLPIFHAWIIKCAHFVCLMHVSGIFHAWYRRVPCLVKAYSMCGTGVLHACVHHTLLLEISCMKLSSFTRMKCAETCMKHACFRRSIYTLYSQLRDLSHKAMHAYSSCRCCTVVQYCTHIK